MEVSAVQSYAGRLRCALIFLREVHINNESMLRYDYKEFSAALGKRVKQLRKERGLTLRALVIQHGFHLTQIQRIEKGDGLSVPTLLRIAEVFQIPVEETDRRPGPDRKQRTAHKIVKEIALPSTDSSGAESLTASSCRP